ncbi:MAG: transporter substrate-binding domain-containing protein [Lachnospiraceae bacterium]
MKKKLLSLLMAGTMLATMLAGCGSTTETATTENTSDTTAETTETTEETTADAGEETRVLKLGIECTYAPYNWTQQSPELPDGSTAVKIENADGYAYGYDVALCQMICEELGWELEVYKSDWTSIFMGLEDGTYDCIMSGVCYTEERDEIYDFTSAYYERTIMAVVREDSEYAGITGLSQFDGMNPNVIAQLGTNFVLYKDQIPSGIDAVDYEAASELFLAIQNQTADVLITERSTAESALATMPGLIMLELDSDDGFVAPEGQSNSCCILFRGGDPECAEIQAAFDSMGWTSSTPEGQAAMDELMSKMIAMQPATAE